MAKKSFFQEPAKAQLKKRNPVVSEGNITEELADISVNDYLVVELEKTPLLKPAFQDEPVKFVKHGPSVVLKQPGTIEQAVSAALEGVRPLDFREQAYESVKENSTIYANYTFYPLIGGERGLRRVVSPLKLVEGARIFFYSEELRRNLGLDNEDKFEFYDNIKIPGIFLRPYDDAKGIKKDGAQILSRIPSYDSGRSRYEGVWKSIPVVNSSRKLAIALGFNSDHTCKYKRFRQICYPYEFSPETSKISLICKHDAAFQYAVIDYYWNIRDELTPIEMNALALPSQLLVKVFKRTLDSLLIFDDSIIARDKLRKANDGEKQAILDNAIKLYGYKQTLYSTRKKDGRLGEYDWDLRK